MTDVSVTISRVLLAGVHVLIGAAAASSVAALGVLFGAAIATNIDLGRWEITVALSALGALTIVVVGAVLTAPGVRSLEVTAARTLLDVTVPDTRDPHDWAARRQGLWWALTSMALGSVALIALLIGLPSGVGLFFPAGRVGSAGILTDMPTPVRAVIGLGAVIVALAVLVGTAILERRLAPMMLAPTATDRLDELRAANIELTWRTRLAHELHDSIGHTLTAMTVQAQAAKAVSQEQNRHLDAIEELGRAALAQLDNTIGRLTAPSDDAPTRGHPLEEIRSMADLAGADLVESGDPPNRLAEPTASAAVEVVREALTNALRHGDGHICVELNHGDILDILVRNRIADATGSPGPGVASRRRGMGLTTMRTRADHAEGTLTIHEEDGSWIVRARFPLEGS